MDKINKLKVPIAILIGSIFLGGFYYASVVSKQASIERQQQMEIKAEADKQASIERQAQMKIDQENEIRIETQAEDNKQQQALSAQQQNEANIKMKCAVFLDRNGNYLVSNETLNTNYNSCLHTNGL